MTWNDQISKRYPWAEIQNKLDELIFELSKAEDEEDVELSLLSLHFGNRVDLSYFTKREQRQIKKKLTVLIEDTRKHCRLLGEALAEMKAHQESLKKEGQPREA